MHPEQEACARQCLEGAETNAMTFSEIVDKLIEAGFESYAVDFRRLSAIYYLPSGDSIELRSPAEQIEVAPALDAEALQAAIREAQTLAPGYTYGGFRRKAKLAGCAGYLVSFTGRRAVYFARTGETHVEQFPD